ncbi:MAG: DUF427 domain-containing protein [Jatrophihabitans sp.]
MTEQDPRDYPAMIASTAHVEPVPRRVRAMIGAQVVLDTTRALYVWEWPYYPQFYIPLADVTEGILVDEDHEQRLKRGVARRQALQVGDVHRPQAARMYTDSSVPGLTGTVRFEWDALDAWFEEDEQIFVHPRNPYVRVDALRSSPAVRVELDGTVLAESSAPVLVFETGLPTRYYLDRTDVDFRLLVPSATQSACPYKGVTSEYWTARVDGSEHVDIAWAYDFPTRQLQPIAGLVAFYNEKVDTFIDGAPVARPITKFS